MSPNVLRIGAFGFFFSNEGFEPLHVDVQTAGTW